MSFGNKKCWVAVNAEGKELIAGHKHERRLNKYWYSISNLNLPKGTIKKLIGKDLTWEDEPVELK